MDSRDREAAFGKDYDKFDESNMTLTYEGICNDDDEEVDLVFAAKYEVCSLCDGRGSHTNPSIDSEGISPDQFDDDPEFRENYFSGLYDVQCYKCGGKRVEPVIDETRADKEALKQLDNHLEYKRDYEREVEAERRFCGW